MTATVSGPARAWAATHSMLLVIVAFAVAAAATIAIVLAVSSVPSPSSPASGPAEEQLTDTQKLCQLARVVGC